MDKEDAQFYGKFYDSYRLFGDFDWYMYLDLSHYRISSGFS